MNTKPSSSLRTNPVSITDMDGAYIIYMSEDNNWGVTEDVADMRQIHELCQLLPPARKMVNYAPNMQFSHN